MDPLRGLFATLKLTKHGKDLLQNREYRYISPSFSLNEDGTPVRLHTASLTNTPAFAGFIDPILNQEAEKAETTTEGKLTMEITKEELVQLIKDTVAEMEKAEEAVDNSCSEEKTEEVKNEETATEEKVEETKEETETEEVKEEPKEEVKEETVTEEVKEEPKEEPKEEVKEEVIKIEALNAAPAALADVSGKSDWMNLHGDAFWKYLAAHPEIKG